MAAIADDAGHAASYLLGAILALHLPDKPANADQHSIRNAIMNRLDFDALKREAFVQTGQVLHISREAIEGFDNDDIEQTLSARVHQLHKAVTTKHRCAGASFILESSDDVEILSDGVGPTQGNLIFSRFFVLKFGRKPGIDHRAVIR
jgi:hypothetical protein